MYRHCFTLGLLLIAGVASGGGVPSGPERLEVIASRVRLACYSQEQELVAPNPQPSVRQVTFAALGLLESGGSPARAEKLVRHALGLQVMDPGAADYGTVPWRQGHPEIKDPNAIEFTMQPVGVILIRHASRLSEGFKEEVKPHVRAAITAIQRHPVLVKYSNIYLMKTVNLLLLGQAVGDPAAVAEGRANFETWLAFTRTNGLTEYASPTYSPIQADCLALAHNLIRDKALKGRMKGVLDLYWADMAASYFPDRQTMTGPSSRNYNSGFLFSDPNVEYSYYLTGLRSRPPSETMLSDMVRAFTVVRMPGYRPGRDILGLAELPERTLRARFGSGPGQDRYLWITPELSLGSSSAYYGPQDRRICAEFASQKRLPLAGFVVDSLDSPFGTVRSTDRSGHSKPHHLPHLLATVQEEGFMLVLADLSPALLTGDFTNLASNILLPARVDQLVLDGQAVDSSKPFNLAAGPGAVVGLREGRAALAVRLFSADGCAGQAPSWKLEFDGNAEGAARLAAHHYQGPMRSLTGPHPRCGFIMMAARCETAREFETFLQRASSVVPVETMQKGVWTVKATFEGTVLEAGLDLDRQEISLRRANGREWSQEILTVNGRDLGRKYLGSAPGPSGKPGH